MKRVFQIVAAAAFLMWRGDASAQIGATSLAAYAGTWRGQIYNDRGDSVRVTWTWVQGADTIGAFTFARETTSVKTRIVTASTDSVVFDLLQVVRPRGQTAGGATLRFVGKRRDDELNGYIIANLPNGQVQQSPFRGTRQPSPPPSASHPESRVILSRESS